MYRRREDAFVIRNVCIHLANEQPLLVDLFDVPTSADAGLLCTNLRSMDGKRPVFIDRIEATFFFPYHTIRFMEIPVGALDGHAPSSGGEGGNEAGTWATEDSPGPSADLRLAVPVGTASGDAESDDDLELEIDEDFLQRIRDI
jgi:hypothetical protein